MPFASFNPTNPRTNCNQYKEDHNKTTDNINLINQLLRLTESQEDSRDKTIRLMLLQKNILSNYKTLDDLNFLLSVRCEDCHCLN